MIQPSLEIVQGHGRQPGGGSSMANGMPSSRSTHPGDRSHRSIVGSKVGGVLADAFEKQLDCF